MKVEKSNAFIVLAIFIGLVSIYYLFITDYLIFIVNKLPGFYGHADTLRNTDQIIRSRGFDAETHFITTSDGYILTVNRIVNPYLVKNGPKLRPILLQHGFLNSANAWIINSGGKLNGDGSYVEDTAVKGEVGNTLGFVLAANGFDVWLANMRGNFYSLNHTKYSHKDTEFWKFSINEMIEYDLPAMIAYILEKTAQKSLGYIGHSQGTYMMFALLSTRPEYSQIVKPFIALSPVPYMGNITSPLRHLGRFLTYYRANPRAFMHWGKLQEFYSQLCEIYYLQCICYTILYNIVGIQENQFNYSRTGVYMANLPSGSSTWNLVHLLQNVASNRPKKFNYGSSGENLDRYGTSEPPNYDLSAINSTNIALIYTANDWLNVLKDIDLLKQNLNVKLLDDYVVPDLRWNHMELLWAIEAGKYVNNRVLMLLNKV